MIVPQNDNQPVGITKAPSNLEGDPDQTHMLMALGQMIQQGKFQGRVGDETGPGFLPGMTTEDMTATEMAQKVPRGISKMVDPEKFDAAVKAMPQSKNIEDRRAEDETKFDPADFESLEAMMKKIDKSRRR